jgi:hypothetical protein
MAIKTMTGGEQGQNAYSRGWHAVTIESVKEGSWNDKKYLDVFFEGYNSSCNLRVYEQHDKETNEEYSVARLFKFANAGIISVLKDQTGNKPVIQYDDDIEGLKGKKLNVLIVDDKKNPKYARVWDRVAPYAHEGEHLSYSEDDVTYWKQQAEASHKKYGQPVVSNGAVHESNQSTPAEEMPF